VRATRERREGRASRRSSTGHDDREPDGSLAGTLLRLQQTAGNAATTALVQRRTEPAKPGPRQEIKSAPNVEITEAEVLPQPMNRGGPVYAMYALTNKGTGPARTGDELWGVPMFEGGTTHSGWERSRDLGRAELPPGGTLRGIFKFTGSHLKIPGNWTMGLDVYSATTKSFSSIKRLPFHIPDDPLP
jgi:hypothetical protein